MANIRHRKNRDGSISYSVTIRKKNFEVCKTFCDEEDAKLYVRYKERLIDNIENFEFKVEDSITLEEAFELKFSTIDESNSRSLSDMKNSKNRLCEILGKKTKLKDLRMEDWLKCAEILMSTDVYHGGVKSERSKSRMSTNTLRKIFAYASSCMSYINKIGVYVENLPLKVLQNKINPMLNENL